MANSNNIVHYVEFFYPYNPDVANSMEDTYIKQVQDRDPSLFVDNESDSKIGYRFFDVDKGSSPLIRENRSNMGPIYYYGEYLSDEEISYINKVMPYTSKSIRMIRCYCGYLATELNDGDTTVEDYMKSRTIDTRKVKVVFKRLKYGFYQNYCSGDGSMYAHYTAYDRAKKHYTIFEEDSDNYYDILDENKPYKKDAKYGETLVTIESELLDILPDCIDDSEREYTLEEILSLIPKMLVAKLSQEKSSKLKKVL